MTATSVAIDGLVSWRDLAACHGQPTSWWFADERSFEHVLAMRVCRTCPVRATCLADALAHEHDQRDVVGLFGGVPASARR